MLELKLLLRNLSLKVYSANAFSEDVLIFAYH